MLLNVSFCVAKGAFKNHLIVNHNYSKEQVSEVVRNLECQEFLFQVEFERATRKMSCDGKASSHILKPSEIPSHSKQIAIERNDHSIALYICEA